MKVWHYEYVGGFYWIAEGESGYRTSAFVGAGPADPHAAGTAIAAARIIDAEISAKPEERDRAAVLGGLSGIRPEVVRPKRGAIPAVLLLSRPGDGFCACVMARDENTWIGDAAFGATEADAASKAEAAFLDQAPKADVISFSDWEQPDTSVDPKSGFRP